MTFTAVDLSTLPAPDVIEELSHAAAVQAIRDDVVARFPEIAPVIDLPSEPARKLIEAFAYRETLLRARINDAARAVFLASATGADLTIWPPCSGSGVRRAKKMRGCACALALLRGLSLWPDPRPRIGSTR